MWNLDLRLAGRLHFPYHLDKFEGVYAMGKSMHMWKRRRMRSGKKVVVQEKISARIAGYLGSRLFP